MVAALPDRVLMLDLETCGFAGSALFLVGLLRQIDGVPTVELLLARNYAEEQAILETLWQTVAWARRTGDVQRQVVRLADGAWTGARGID